MRTRRLRQESRARTPSPTSSPSQSTTDDVSYEDEETTSDNEAPLTGEYNLRDRASEDDYREGSEIESEDLSMDLETSETDSHEDACHVCGMESAPERLLCCDTCALVYHLRCLDPPLQRVPKGKWMCPNCAEIFNLEGLERILAERMAPEAAFYVKWKGKSYRHCSWVSKALYRQGMQSFHHLRHKLRLFEQKDQEDIELRAYDPTEFTNGVHKSWTTVEKILETTTSHNKFLVKWKGLGFDECSWEEAEDITDAKNEIERFLKTRSVRQDARRRMKSKQVRRRSSSATDSASDGMVRFTETPKFLNKDYQLHDYQLEGLTWLKFKWDQKENVILADEMGLGKTIQAIAYLAALWDESVCLPHLIVVPLSTIHNWQREFETWAPQMKVVALIGNKAERSTILKHEIYLSKHLKYKKKSGDKKRIKCHVVLTSYEIVSLEATALRKIDFACLIVDEGHRLKGKSSKLVKELNTFVCHHRTLLTGTPLQNNIQELFALLHFLDARKFDSWESFEADFAKISEKEQVKKLHALLTPHLLRRLKKDVLKDLPPKKEQIVRVEMTEAQRGMYKSILAKNFHLLITDKKSDQIRRGLLSIVTDLRKCCAHPYLFEGIENMNLDKESELQQMISVCGKLDLLDRLLSLLKEGGHRVLIYSQFVIMLNILEDYLTLKNYGFLRIDGGVGGSERQILIDAFNREPNKYFVFLLSTRAGGLGINLASADTVILYDSDYNPHNDIQAQARVHRLGQEKPVLILRMVTRLTIEERMIQLAKEKLVLEQIVVHKMGKMELKQDELDGILRYGAAELFADERLADISGNGMTVTERESERLAADTSSKRIVYDTEALLKLLDRSDMTPPDEAMEVDNGELMEGFKIANFDVAMTPEKPDMSWQEILKHRREAQDILQQKAKDPYLITPGRRRRRNEVVYNIDDAGSDDSLDSEFNAEGQDNDEETESTDLEDDLGVDEEKAKSRPSPKSPVQNEAAMHPNPAVVVQRSIQNPAIVAQRTIHKQAVKRTIQNQPSDVSQSNIDTPIMCWSEGQLYIQGFSTRERHLFLNLVLRFGFPEGAPDGDNVEWREFQCRLPRKKHLYIDAYARILLAAARGQVPAGIQLEDLLFDCKAEDLLSKVATMDRFRKKLHRMGNQHSKLWNDTPSAINLYSYNHYWSEAQDWALVRAVTRFGLGRWKDYMNNGENNMSAVLCQELRLELPSEEAIDLSQSPERQTGDSSEAPTRTADDESARKSKLRSMENKCRNWMSGRLKLLSDFIAAETLPPGRHNIQLATQAPPSTPLIVTGSLKWKHQAMIRHCFNVRECSNRVSGTQTFEELQAAGVQFRTQMQELGQMAESLCQSLPPDFETFKQKELELRQREMRSAQWMSATQGVVGARLDQTLGTSKPPVETENAAAQDVSDK